MDTQKQTGVSGKVKVNNDPACYDAIAARVNERFGRAMLAGPLFHTNAARLFEAYLAFLPMNWIQHHRCYCCRHFFERYGDLAYVGLDGHLLSALWHEEDAEDIYVDTFGQLRKSIERSEITGAFVTSEPGLGTPATGIWTHFRVVVPEDKRYKPELLTTSQREAEIAQDYILVQRTLAKYTAEHFEMAIKILSSDRINRGEKIVGPVQWFMKLKLMTGEVGNRVLKQNMVWRAVALGPSGFAHLNNSVAGTVLEDLRLGKSFEQISRSVNTKTDSQTYQRPTEAPTEETIKIAEEAFQKLGLAASLRRRYALLEEVEAIWRPSAPEEQPRSGKLFGHLKPKGTVPATSNIVLPTETMTWLKFAGTVLPTAKTIELKPPYLGNYFGILTATDPMAPPLIQWDSEDERNPFSWYVYHEGSRSYNWNLDANVWVAVTAITDLPCRWKGKVNSNFDNGRMFVLSGAWDNSPPSAGLFPEVVRTDLQHVRSVIEAYSKSATPEGRMEATACGLLMIDQSWGHTLRVNGDRTYKIDRWD